MRKASAFKVLFICNALLHAVAVLLIFTVLLMSFTGCGSKKTTSDKGTSSETSVSSDNNSSSSGDNFSSQDSSTESNSDTQDSTVYSLFGDISYDAELETQNKRDDYGEIIPSGNCANLSNPLKGYAEKEAEALRQEILGTGNTEEYYKITGTKYYISPRGNDSNSGTSPDKPFRTIEAINSVYLKAGDAVLFERDSVFRLVQPISAVEGVIYGSYGEGEKPKLYCSPKNFAESVWEPSKKKNVWQTNYVYDVACNMVFDHGKEVGYLKTSLRNVTANTHFYQDEAAGVIYLYCDKGNPAKVYESIEISPKMFHIIVPTGVDNVVVDNLCLKYAGSGGVTYYFGNDGGIITNCEMGYIGGQPFGNVRAGNAIGGWQGNRNMRWDHNWIYQTFDTAISPQGFGGEGCLYENISISNNLLEYNNADLEFWDPGATFRNIVMDNNICRFTSLGWGSREDDGGYRGIEGIFVADTEQTVVEGTISAKNTIIDCPGRQVINWKIKPSDWPKYDTSGTKLYFKNSYRTTDEVMRGSKRKNDDPDTMRAVTLEELTVAMMRFDPTMIIKWYD